MTKIQQNSAKNSRNRSGKNSNKNQPNPAKSNQIQRISLRLRTRFLRNPAYAEIQRILAKSSGFFKMRTPP
jgi:hypothetical protein